MLIPISTMKVQVKDNTMYVDSILNHMDIYEMKKENDKTIYIDGNWFSFCIKKTKGDFKCIKSLELHKSISMEDFYIFSSWLYVYHYIVELIDDETVTILYETNS